MEALPQVEAVSSSQNVKALQYFFDTISSHIRSQESLLMREETYGNLLCPVLIKKIPPAVAYPGFQRERCLRSGPIQKVGGGGGASGPIYEKWGGGALQVRYTNIRKVGGGGGALQVRYTKSGGGGGGGAFRFRSDTFGHTENIYITQAENFTYIGCIA